MEKKISESRCDMAVNSEQVEGWIKFREQWISEPESKESFSQVAAFLRAHPEFVAKQAGVASGNFCEDSPWNGVVMLGVESIVKSIDDEADPFHKSPDFLKRLTRLVGAEASEAFSKHLSDAWVSPPNAISAKLQEVRIAAGERDAAKQASKPPASPKG